MRFFKFGEKGEVLAIAIPASLQKSANVKEGDEFEFIDLGEGAFFLASRARLNEIAKTGLLARLGEKLVSSSSATPASSHSPPSSSTLNAKHAQATLEKDGFLVVDEEGAKAVSQSFEQQIKAGLVMGVRGFDKRYYIVSRPFYEHISSKIRVAAAGKDVTPQEMASAAQVGEEAATAVLHILKEEGDAIEKRRGLFRLVA